MSVVHSRSRKNIVHSSGSEYFSLRSIHNSNLFIATVPGQEDSDAHDPDQLTPGQQSLFAKVWRCELFVSLNIILCFVVNNFLHLTNCLLRGKLDTY